MTIMPIQKPGRSKQDYATPRDFLAAVKRRRLGIEEFAYDLAADAFNTTAELFFSEQDDALTRGWYYGLLTHAPSWLWLNPPFAHIAPWAEKCAGEAVLGAKIAFLVPAAVGSNWFAQYVAGKARVVFFRPRLSFDGIAPYSKDCMLCLYGLPPGYETWNWRTNGP